MNARAAALAPVALARASALPPVASVLDDLAEWPQDVYIVGGTIRDLLLGRKFLDVDLAVDGEAQELARAIGGQSGAETRFGTISVERDGHRYDLARTRAESYASPGALPDVAPAGIDADLRRRDFTVNAMALGLSGPHAGELLATDGALEDLELRQLAVLHDLSFLDDPTRLLRLGRYAARLGFSVAAHTRALADEAISGGALNTVSGTRVGNELRLLANEADPIAAFEAVAGLGLPWRIARETAAQALGVLPPEGRRDMVVLATVFATSHPEQLIAELDRLGFTATDRAAIAEAATRSRDLAKRLAGAGAPSEIARVVGTSGIETVAVAYGLGASPQSLRWLRDLRHRELQITGNDLINNGIEEGPAVGRALARARAALLDGNAPDRDSQLRVALNPGE